VHLEGAVVLDEAELAKLVHEEVTRERVVPTISASVSCDSFGSTRCDVFAAEPGQQQQRASRFSLELKS
jgi:hypothetical protein